MEEFNGDGDARVLPRLCYRMVRFRMLRQTKRWRLRTVLVTGFDSSEQNTTAVDGDRR
jgi:hypothetical protein